MAPRKKRKRVLKQKSRSLRGVKTGTLDLLWSKVIKTRDRWVCQKCVEDPDNAKKVFGGRGLQAAHIFTRTRHCTRWDILNGKTLCAGHHMFFHKEPLLFHDWIRKKLGSDQYESLAKKYRAGTKTSIDRDLIKKQLTDLLSLYEERNQQPLGSQKDVS